MRVVPVMPVSSKFLEFSRKYPRNRPVVRVVRVIRYVPIVPITMMLFCIMPFCHVVFLHHDAFLQHDILSVPIVTIVTIIRYARVITIVTIVGVAGYNDCNGYPLCSDYNDCNGGRACIIVTTRIIVITRT